MEQDYTILKYLPFGYFKQITEVNGANTYKCYAANNTADTDAKWFVIKIEETVIVDIQTYRESFANNISFNDRITATYDNIV